jgi:hypothetical protein
MNHKKAENSSPSTHSPNHANPKKEPVRQIISAYESAPFSLPLLDQFRGIMPTFNRRLSPEIDLRLSPVGHPRLSPGRLPRLISSSCSGIETPFSEIRSDIPKTPVGEAIKVKPDLAGRTLSGAHLCSLTISADFSISSLRSKPVTIEKTDDQFKKVEIPEKEDGK